MDHVVDGTASLSEFRYQVRLGVGKHTFTFLIPLLPFYISFKPWYLLFSIFIGLTCGHLYQFIVLKCRKKFKKNVKKVVFGASIVAILLGSVAFASGISFMDTVWNWYVYLSKIYFTVLYYKNYPRYPNNAFFHHYFLAGMWYTKSGKLFSCHSFLGLYSV